MPILPEVSMPILAISDLPTPVACRTKSGACPVLVGSDHRSKAVWAMVDNEKGPTESAVKWIDGKLNQAGCRGMK